MAYNKIMNRTIRPIVFISIVLVAIFLTALSFFLFATRVNANPSQYTETVQTATATSSVVYMTPGTATSTLVYDTYRGATTGNNYVNNQMELLEQLTASSTGTQLNTNLEYSNGYPGVDCVATPNACDWYQDTGTNVNGFGTTTLPYNVAQVASYQWKYASTTPGLGVVPGNANRDGRALSVNVPTRYVRAIFSLAIGGTNGAVWAQFVPAKETK